MLLRNHAARNRSIGYLWVNHCLIHHCANVLRTATEAVAYLACTNWQAGCVRARSGTNVQDGHPLETSPLEGWGEREVGDVEVKIQTWRRGCRQRDTPRCEPAGQEQSCDAGRTRKVEERRGSWVIEVQGAAHIEVKGNDEV